MKKKILIPIIIVVVIIIGLSIYLGGVSSPRVAKSDINSETFYNADHTGFVIKYPDSSGFSIKPPEPVSDWIFSNEWNRERGVAVSFNKKDDADKSPLIYVRRKVLEKDCGNNISGLIACDKANFANDETELIIKDLPVLTTDSGSKVYRVSYSIEPRYGQKAQYDETAYIDADGAVDMLVLVATSKDDLTKAQVAFDMLLKSYMYLPDAKSVSDTK
jgi:hypothetical protein